MEAVVDYRQSVSATSLEVSLISHHPLIASGMYSNWTSYAVFRLERFTEVSEFTYLGKHFPCVNAN